MDQQEDMFSYQQTYGDEVSTYEEQQMNREAALAEAEADYRRHRSTPSAMTWLCAALVTAMVIQTFMMHRADISSKEHVERLFQCDQKKGQSADRG